MRYCMLPNGIINDRVRQVGGRYRDSTDFDFMMRMGVGPRIFRSRSSSTSASSKAIRESSISSPIPPTWARPTFMSRAAGAFLVSASWNGQTVSSIQLLSEKGNKVQFLNPWKGRRIAVKRHANSATVEITQHGEILEFPTEPNQTYSILSR